jgi:hypothetical protein
MFGDENFVFSCYMNNRTAEFAFWVEKEKYVIDEKLLVTMFSRFENYFSEP